MKLSTSTFNNVTECGLVSATSVYGIGFITYILYSFCSFFGCSSSMMADKIDMAKQEATSEIEEKAKKMHADGIMGIRYQMSFLSVMVYGTAFRYNTEKKSDESATNKNSLGSAGVHKMSDNKHNVMAVPEKAHKQITDKDTAICSFCNFEQPVDRKVCWHCGVTFYGDENSATSAAPYFCGNCKKAGPFEGDCPSCGSSIKRYNTFAK